MRGFFDYIFFKQKKVKKKIKKINYWGTFPYYYVQVKSLVGALFWWGQVLFFAFLDGKA